MAAARRDNINELFELILLQEPAVTGPEELLEFARRNSIARHHRVSRRDATEFLRPEGRAQVYKRVPVEWPGRISKPTETDVRFDLDLWDGRTQAPADQPVKWVMLLQDRLSHELYGIGLESRQTNVLLDAFNTLYARALGRCAPGPPGGFDG